MPGATRPARLTVLPSLYQAGLTHPQGCRVWELADFLTEHVCMCSWQANLRSNRGRWVGWSCCAGCQVRCCDRREAAAAGGMGRCTSAHVRVGELAASVSTLAERSYLSGVLVGLPVELQRRRAESTSSCTAGTLAAQSWVLGGWCAPMVVLRGTAYGPHQRSLSRHR